MRSRTARLALGVVTLLVVCARFARADEFSDDLEARRQRVLSQLSPNSILVLWSAPSRNYSLDIDYEYRQDSNLYYLTGLTQENTVLVLMPGNVTRREILFVQDRDVTREHWNGRVLDPDEAAESTGVPTVFTRKQFDGFIDAVLGGHPFEAFDEHEQTRFSDAIRAGDAQIELILPRDGGEPSPANQFAKTIRDRFPTFRITDATPILTNLRMIKTPYEQKVLVKSLQISSDAQMVGMRTAHPGAFEYEVKAAIEGAYRGHGAVSWAYPSIVGSGPNATILHYPEDGRQMRPGDLLLVDAAANYRYMSGDITRTYPVTGKFTDAQKDVYAVVLKAQEEGMKTARAGSSLAAIHNSTVEVVKEGLLKLGLITDASGDQYKMWYTHGATHYIGIDVHDVGDRNRALEPGMSFVIEPGLYIRQSALDALPKTPENAALIQAIQPAVTRYLDLGIRIEDSFLLEPSGLRRLSATVPRTIEEIETFMRKNR